MRAFLLASLLLSSFTAHAAAFDPALEAMAERRPEAAITVLREKIAKQTQGADRLQYLLARALYHTRRYDEAVRAADTLREKWPASPYARKATFLKADCYAAQKDFGRADALYIGEAAHLVSTKRKEEVAATYLRIADK